eukprot:TRINITY_DN9962_c0_g1_i1.p1 TRINITY_DN9962_c0_g1~~TRINITY_DN9962_c0_g1_i1.p1  ORF type:complete len:120 (+),score=31.87 TRINITY_DN9962_c0_g1_i1:404-763(+)
MTLVVSQKCVQERKVATSKLADLDWVEFSDTPVHFVTNLSLFDVCFLSSFSNWPRDYVEEALQESKKPSVWRTFLLVLICKGKEMHPLMDHFAFLITTIPFLTPIEQYEALSLKNPTRF